MVGFNNCEVQEIMNCLIVNAHPDEDSFCQQISRQVIDELNRRGHCVVVENLYQSGFDPVLSATERKSYYSDRYQGELVARQQQELLHAEILVLVFPTWWFGFPAILKGWFDRVWSPGVAFDHGQNFGPIKPRLPGISRVFVVTSLGAPWWIDWFIMRRPVRRIIKTALLGACAPQAKLDYVSLYESEKLNEEKFVAFSHKIKGIISGWG